MEHTIKDTLDLGVWIGRGQAFGVVANGCTAAQAECLRQISESGTYKQTGLTWEDFCQEYIGLSRPRVDALIHNLEEFGRTYFDLSNIVRISPEAYRRVASTIKEQSIQIGTELVPIIPENAPRIRRAIQEARSDARKSWHEAYANNANVRMLMMEFQNTFNRAENLAGHALITQKEWDDLQMFLEFVRGRADALEQTLDRSPRARTSED